MAVTRSDLISTLKSRGVKGKLSKMRKHELQELLRSSAPGGESKEPTGITLEPDDQAGGHYFNKKGETKSDGKHEHRTDPWPVVEKAKPAPPKPKKTKKKYNAVDPRLKRPVAGNSPDKVVILLAVRVQLTEICAFFTI